MDTTKTLKSRLRDRLVQWRTEAESARKAADAERERLYDLFRDIPDAEPDIPDAEPDIPDAEPDIPDAERERLYDLFRDIPDAERARLGADRTRRVSVYILLSRLAGDEEIGLLAAQLGERRPLKVTGSIWPMDECIMPGSLPPVEWIIARPGRESPTLPQSIGDPLIVWDIVFDAVIPEWIDFLDAAAPSPDGLTPDARAFLKAMVVLKLHDGTRAGQDETWAKVAELGEAVEGKSRREAAVGILKDRKLIDSKSGTGTMLTPAGVDLARSLSSPSNSE